MLVAYVSIGTELVFTTLVQLSHSQTGQQQSLSDICRHFVIIVGMAWSARATVIENTFELEPEACTPSFVSPFLQSLVILTRALCEKSVCRVEPWNALTEDLKNPVHRKILPSSGDQSVL